MEILSTVFSLVLVVFIVSMMLAAGLSATIASLGQVFRRFWLVILVLVVNFVVIPLLGWGVAELFALATPAFIAMVLVACSPGAPFGVKPAVASGGDVVTASSLQILMAALGSFTFPFTANWILTAANLGEGISLPVGRLVGTVVVLQIVPFIVGMAIRNWAPHVAGGWLKTSMKVSGMFFFAVLVLALLGGWKEIVDLIGSRTMLAALVLAVLALALGTLVAAGPARVRTTVGLLAPNRNAGPVFAAIGIAFANDPAILGAATAIMLIGTVVSILVASFLARKHVVAGDAPAPASAAAESAGLDVEL
jgi:bile acid:Na+ symporter, BASS family